MKTLKFRGFKTKWILEGEKTASLRIFDDKDLRVGDDLDLINWDSGQSFAKAKVTEVIEKKLGELEEADFLGHEKYESKAEMYQILKKYYGEGVETDTPAKIVRFELL